MKGEPLVSVLLPFYNAEKYLGVAIESILNQTYSHFELLLLDDGSSEQSLKIAEHYAKQDTRIKVYHHENMGVCGTLQRGVSLAQGKYIARMDADDIACPERFQQQLHYLEQNPDCVVLGTRTVVVDPENQILYSPQVSTGHEEILKELLQWRGSRLCHPTVMMPTEAVKAVGGYTQEYMNDDIDLFLKLTKSGKFANLPEPLLRHRVHLSSVCHTRDESEVDRIKKRIYFDAIANLSLSQEFLEANQITPPTSSLASDYYSAYEVYRRWCLLARRSGFYRSSLKYCYKTFVNQPFQAKTYWTLFHCLMGEHYGSALWKFLMNIRQTLSAKVEQT